MTRFPEMTVTVAASILIGETQLAEKQFDKLKFAGSAGEARGVPRFGSEVRRGDLGGKA